ncbi:2307_t:CDS:2, partial [Cetraspora pellucida]
YGEYDSGYGDEYGKSSYGDYDTYGEYDSSYSEYDSYGDEYGKSSYKRSAMPHHAKRAPKPIHRMQISIA